MPLHVFVIVLAAAMLHASWNTLVKSGNDKFVASTLIALGSAVVALPLACALPMPALASAPYIVASGIVHGAYFALIGIAYRSADLSIAYPVARGAAPLVATIGAAMFLGEMPNELGLAGVGLLALGVLWLAVDGLRRGGLDRVSGIAAALNAFVIALYTLVDGEGGRVSGAPVSYNAWASLADAAVFLPIAFYMRGKPLMQDFILGWKTVLLGGGASFAAYAIAVWAMTQAPIALVAAVRETSVLFAAVFASLFLHERFGRRRYVAAALVAGGLVALRFA